MWRTDAGDDDDEWLDLGWQDRVVASDQSRLKWVSLCNGRLDYTIELVETSCSAIPCNNYLDERIELKFHNETIKQVHLR